MTRLVLLGIIGPTVPFCARAPRHIRLPAGERDALALPLTPQIDPGSEAGTVALVQAQNAILCHYAATGDVLPVAPGGVFSGPDTLLRHVQAEAPRLARLEARFAGRAEYALSVLAGPLDVDEGTAESGRDHLRLKARARDRRGARTDARRRFLGRVADIVTARSEAIRLRSGSGTDRLARVDFLMARNCLEACRQHLETTLDEARSLALTMRLAGPYPAFSFVGEDDHAG